jgi:6-phosphogluconate dehydrogenase
MHIAYIGLGKMGRNMVERLLAKGHTVTAFDPDEKARAEAASLGAEVVDSLADLMQKTASPRTVWLMVPHQVVDNVLDELAPHLVPGDTVIEGGNSPYKKTKERARVHTERSVLFLDAGVSGGPGGAKEGACIMVGGDKVVFDEYEQLFKDLSVEGGYAYMGKHGAGHFVKMVHNGIEYGMMQALAEGFDIMQESEFDLNLVEVARLYNHGSVIESKLVGWLHSGFVEYGQELSDITGSASASGEGLWTVETAHEMGVDVNVIEDSLKAREKTQKQPSYQGKLISVMRNQFGGHAAHTEK